MRHRPHDDGEAGAPTPVERPPVGVTPWWLIAEHRVVSVQAACDRYRDAGLEPLPEWLTELAILRGALAQHGTAPLPELRVLPDDLEPYDVVINLDDYEEPGIPWLRIRRHPGAPT